MEYRTDNPCDRVQSALGPQQHVVRLMKALPHPEVAAAIVRVCCSCAQPMAKLAFELLVLTAARRSDVRWAG